MGRFFISIAAVGLFAIAAAARAAYSPEQIMALNYPPLSLQRGEQGVVGVSLRIDAHGRVARCAVSHSSGYAELDRASCPLMIGQVRLHAERIEGRRQAVERAAQILWQLPAVQLAGIAAPPPRSSTRDLAEAAKPVTCHRSLKPGTLLVEETLCVNDADWRRVVDYGQSQLRNYTSDGGDFSPY